MTYPTLKTHRVTWYTDVEAADALEAVRKVASENFQARIAEGYEGTACVFVCECEDHEGRAVTIDLAEHRYQLECCHADTCFPDYWGGHHLAHIQVPVYNGMSLAELKKALMSELNEGAVDGSDAPHDYDEQWYAAARFAVQAIEAFAVRAIEAKTPAAAAENLFPLLIPQGDDDDVPTVYAFFVFRPTEVRTRKVWTDLPRPDEEGEDEEGEDDGKPDEADPTCSEIRP